jgi:hypothetical protein
MPYLLPIINFLPAYTYTHVYFWYRRHFIARGYHHDRPSIPCIRCDCVRGRIRVETLVRGRPAPDGFPQSTRIFVKSARGFLPLYIMYQVLALILSALVCLVCLIGRVHARANTRSPPSTTRAGGTGRVHGGYVMTGVTYDIERARDPAQPLLTRGNRRGVSAGPYAGRYPT